MRKLLLAILCLAAHDLYGGCLSFLDPPFGSNCSRSTGELVWLNSNRLLERVKVPKLPYDPQIYDPVLEQGLAVKGDLEFELRTPGPDLVEVFLAAQDDPRYSFTLEANGKPVDTRYQAIKGAAGPGPKSGLRIITLLGIVSGAFTVRSDSPRYIISAVRWTPRKEFEERLVPAWLDRARGLLADPFLDNLRARRRDSLEQLYDRLALSMVPEIHNEAVIGQTRAAYWLAAENQQPRDLARTDSLFHEAFKLAPENKVLREMISSSCAGRNVQNGQMPRGDYCNQVTPVFWTVILTPDPPGAPEWAVAQRRLAARLEAITEWWTQRRQRSDGELGGGREADAQMLRQWGPQALGFGAPAAINGIQRMADGLRKSRIDPDDYVRQISGVVQPSGPGPDGRYDALFAEAPSVAPTTALPRLAELAKQSEAALARDFEMYTSEVLFTDRVYYGLRPEYLQWLLGGVSASGARSPSFAVTWSASDAQFARVVREATSSSLKFQFYNFENRAVNAEFRVWRLEPGTYQWESADQSGAPDSHGEFYVTRLPQTASVPLPPFKEITVAVHRFKP